MEVNFNKVDNEILKLDNDEALDISSIEDILVKNIEEYKIELHKHVEELLQQQIDENKIIIKKNRNGEIVDITSVTKENKN